MTTIATNSSKGITLSAQDTTIAGGVSISNTSGRNVVTGPAPTAWTLVNDGQISGRNSDGVSLDNGGYVSNAASGAITSPQHSGINIAGAPGTVINAGNIANPGSGVAGVALWPDTSGTYWIVQQGSSLGWVSDGQFHRMQPFGTVQQAAWLAGFRCGLPS